MKPSKSINSLNNTNNTNQPHNNNHHQPTSSSNNLRRTVDPSATMTSNSLDGPTSPICRCRVMYLGSSVPHITKDGLQGIQEPLRELYPDPASLASGNAGIDSWLSVWSNGILVENVDDNGREVKRFFKIEALHYCAAVTYVPQTTAQQQQSSSQSTLGGGNLPKFLPLDSPYARQQANANPPIFASILRRTTGIKVLECHAFICKREAAANALVRCCFHAYADTMYAKQFIEIHNKNNLDAQSSSNMRINENHLGAKTLKSTNNHGQKQPMVSRRSKSIANLNYQDNGKDQDNLTPSESSDYNQESTSGQMQDVNYQNPNQILRRKSMNEHYAAQNGGGQNSLAVSQQQQQQQAAFVNHGNLQRQSKSLSKSMHHLNQEHPDSFRSAQDMNEHAGIWSQHQVPHHQQPFYNPQAGRVPSYPPQSLIDAANSGGTLKSIKSMAATSIASTLLRSKKHAKAMSMAQLNQEKITSFHQPHLMNGNAGGHTLAGPMMMPPVPNMFMPNMQRPIINGSQTMKAPSRSMVPMMGPPINFEAMTPKEMKKLLKKSAKYGIDPKKFTENGLPLLPLRPPPSQLPIAPHSKSGTMISQSCYSMYGNDMPDMVSVQSLQLHRSGTMPPSIPPPIPLDCPMDSQSFKPILVKPNPEFLKSKAGKKWLKQQKEFKKLLPPHLEGLPIVFGPPPIEALEPAAVQPNGNLPMPPTFIPPPPPQQGLPVMDSSGYYNPHPFYGPSGRTSVASTMMRHSPLSQIHQMHDSGIHPNGLVMGSDYMQPSQSMYGHNMVVPPMIHAQVGADYMTDSSSGVYGRNGISDQQQGHLNNGIRHRDKRHVSNQMVEQSIISLGDENDHDDEEDECVNGGTDCAPNGYQQNDPNSHQGNYIRSSSGPSSKAYMNDCNGDHLNNNYLENGAQQQEYEQVGGQYSDDQSSYSSGIYRRGHMNERAFSHSIRQEHRNNVGQNLETDYVSNHEQHAQDHNRRHHQPSQGAKRDCHNENGHRSHPGKIFQNTRDQNNIYFNDHNEPQTIPVNELTARLESQLNMKSFANSRIKSHM